MKSSYFISVSVSQLLLLVMARGSGVRGQLCPQGLVTHSDREPTRCCQPANCAPNHFLKYCERNGTQDSCEPCPGNFRLFKRTSSFAVEPCHTVLIYPRQPNECSPVSGTSDAALEDLKNSCCDLETGYYYHHPQVPLGLVSFCQPIIPICDPGFQPTQKGKCEACPPNTVQDEKAFKLCRPQRNCTAMRLEIKIRGNTTKETVCAKPPPPPVDPAYPGTKPSTSLEPLPPSKSTTAAPPDASVRPSVNSTADNDAPVIVVVAVLVAVLLVSLGLFFFIGRRKGWFSCIWKGKCHRQDVERHTGQGGQIHLDNRDNDNSSDNSCYTCTDSCLTSSNKNNSNTVGKSGDHTKPPRPLPMLEAYMNMNGKCPQSLSSSGSISEPFYNSIGHGMSDSHMPSYKNTSGFPPPLHNYPNRVHLTSGDEDDSVEKHCYAQVPPRNARMNEVKDREDFSETDPLLTGSENCSSGVPTPVGTPALRGILRNGNNRQEPKRPGPGENGGEGGGSSNGNRPHLSMLLNATEETSHASEDSQAENLPHLSQLVSAERSVQGPGSQHSPQLQRQQLLQQRAPPQPQPQDLLPQRPQQGSPLAARLIPVPLATQQPQLNPSLVQMEELKPVMPLSPGPAEGPAPSAATGACKAKEGKERSGSPARIKPTHQEEVRVGGGGGGQTAAQRPVGPAVTNPAAAIQTKKDRNGKGLAKQPGTATKSEYDEDTVKKEIDEETFRKEEVLATSPGCDETMQKSVGGSSGLGDSLDFSSPLDVPSEEDGRSRTKYRRSNSEASRSVSPAHQLPPSRSISSPEEKHRPFAVVKPMQSDQSLNTISSSQDRLTELTHQLDAAGRHFPLTSLCGRSPGRQSSQESSDDPEQTRPKTPDNLSEEEEEYDTEEARQGESEARTHATFYGDNDPDRADEAGGRDKGSGGSSEG